MKRLILSLALAAGCVLAFTTAGCAPVCTQEDQDNCRAAHSDCTYGCDPLSGGYTQCVDDCDDALDRCLEDHGCS